MSDDVLTTRQLSKVFRKGLARKAVAAVSGLDLTVHAGEIYGFLGPNGAGKSTTIKMLMGLVFPTAGEARLFGHLIPSREARAQVGFLPENPYFHDFLTPAELLRFAGGLSRLGGAALDRRTDELLELVGLARFADVPLRKFSKGMVQRAGIAQALVADPRLVVLDEPMSGLDPIGRKDVREIIFRLKEEGKTVFFSTHILPDVEAICDRVGLMLAGRLHEEGRLDDLLGARTRAVEIIAERLPPEVAERLAAAASRSLPKGSGLALSFADDARADEAVAAIVAAGGRLVSLARHRESLEDLFMRKAEEAGAATPGGRIVSRVG
jgi:ABC-2 type transport system ATP-binding protein